MPSGARSSEPVRAWHVEISVDGSEDMVEFESATGGRVTISLPPEQGSLLLRACHPSLVWRVLAWEPRWSAGARIEIRPSGQDRANVRVIDPTSTVTGIFRVPLVIALAISRQGALPVAVHHSLIGRRVSGLGEEDLDEVDGFKAFLSGPAPHLAPRPQHDVLTV